MSSDKEPKKSPDSFADLVDGVRRIKSDRAAARPPPPQPIPTQRIRDERNALLESQNAPDPVDAEIEAGEALRWCKGGVERDLRRLRRGDFAVQGSIDLHGMTAPEARLALLDFIDDAIAEDCRCIRVIHGKGHGSPGRVPVLKGKTARWLRQHTNVLAYCSAPSHDGGTGVAWVLLARRR